MEMVLEEGGLLVGSQLYVGLIIDSVFITFTDAALIVLLLD